MINVIQIPIDFSQLIVESINLFHFYFHNIINKMLYIVRVLYYPYIFNLLTFLIHLPNFIAFIEVFIIHLNKDILPYHINYFNK